MKRYEFTNEEAKEDNTKNKMESRVYDDVEVMRRTMSESFRESIRVLLSAEDKIKKNVLSEIREEDLNRRVKFIFEVSKRGKNIANLNRAPLRGNTELKRYVIMGAREAINLGLDFRQFYMSYLALEEIDIPEYFRKCAMLIYDLQVPLLQYRGKKKYDPAFIDQLIEFYKVPRHYFFKSAVIGSRDPDLITFLNELEQEGVVKYVPKEVLARSTYAHMKWYKRFLKTDEKYLMRFCFRDDLMTSTQPEVWISRFSAGMMRGMSEDVYARAKSVYETVGDAAKDIFNFAIGKIKERIDNIGGIIRDSMKKGFSPKEEDIMRQVRDNPISAGVGEIDIPVLKKLFTRTKTFKTEINLVKKTFREIFRVYGKTQVDSRYEIILMKQAVAFEEEAIPNRGKRKDLDPFTAELYEELKVNELTGDSLEQYIKCVFKYPPENMWTVSSVESIEPYFNKFIYSYEKWLDKQMHSGMKVVGISHIKVNFLLVQAGGCGHITRTLGKSVFVPKNEPGRNDCLWQCLACAIHPDDKMMRKGRTVSTALRRLSTGLKREYFEKISVPEYADRNEMVGLDEIPRIAKTLEMNITVFRLDEYNIRKKLVEYKRPDFSKSAILHFAYNEETKTGHYCLVNTLHGYGMEDVNIDVRCERCGKAFIKDANNHQYRYRKHVEKCMKIEKGEVELRFKEKPVIRPKSKMFQLTGEESVTRLVCFYDFEATLERINADEDQMVKLTEIEHHKANGVVFKVYDTEEDRVLEEFTLRIMDEDCAKKLADHLTSIEPALKKILGDHFRKISPSISKKLYRKLSVKANKANIDKEVGRMMAQIYQEYTTVPVMAFNASHYDIFFVLKYLRKEEINKVLTSSGDLLSMHYGIYKFADPRKFVNGSLQSFANAYSRTPIKMEKDVFPYRFVDSFEKLYTRKWPAYSFFEKNKVSQEDYDKRKVLFEEQCKDPDYNLGKYMLEYCDKDVDMLIEGTKGFSKTFLEREGFDIYKFCTMPQLAFSIALNNYVKTPIYTIPDREAYEIVNKTLYGGNCQVFGFHSKCGEGEYGFELDANNLYGKGMTMPLAYRIVSKEERSKMDGVRYIEEFLRKPIEDFNERLLFGKLSKEELAHCGVVVCDLSFTKSQIRKQEKFPCIPVKRTIEESELSPIELDNLLGMKEQGKDVMTSEKLVYDCLPKKAYSIPAHALKFMLQMDLVTVDKILAYLPCEVNYVFKNFAEQMTNNRAKGQEMINEGLDMVKKGIEENNIKMVEEGKSLQSKGTSIKESCKLCNNSSYGKTIQDDTRFGKTIISTHSADNQNIIAKNIITDVKVVATPDPKNFGMDDEGMAIISATSPTCSIKSPRQLGAYILWNSKIIMLDFVYNSLLKYIPDCEINYTDTDSVHIKIKQLPGADAEARLQLVKQLEETFYGKGSWKAEDAARLLEYFPEPVRKKYFPKDKNDVTVGLMKIDKFEQEAVFLKPKTYYVAQKNAAGAYHNKGVNLFQNKDALNLDNYKKALYSKLCLQGTNTMIRKVQGKRDLAVKTLRQTKWIMDPFYDKRYRMFKDGKFYSLPYGHPDIPAPSLGKRLAFNLIRRTIEKAQERAGIRLGVAEAVKIIGLDGVDIVKYLEEEYKTRTGYELNWNLYGLKRNAEALNIDHIISCAKISDRQSLEKIANYSNLRVIAMRVNSSKNAK